MSSTKSPGSFLILTCSKPRYLLTTRNISGGILHFKSRSKSYKFKKNERKTCDICSLNATPLPQTEVGLNTSLSPKPFVCSKYLSISMQINSITLLQYGGVHVYTAAARNSTSLSFEQPLVCLSG